MTDTLKSPPRFTQTQTWPVFNVTCAGCGKHMTVSESTPIVWADTQGKPFVDYYCDPCKNAKEATK